MTAHLKGHTLFAPGAGLLQGAGQVIREVVAADAGHPQLLLALRVALLQLLGLLLGLGQFIAHPAQLSLQRPHLVLEAGLCLLPRLLQLHLRFMSL